MNNLFNFLLALPPHILNKHFNAKDSSEAINPEKYKEVSIAFEGSVVRFEREYEPGVWVGLPAEDIPHYKSKGQAIRPLFAFDPSIYQIPAVKELLGDELIKAIL